MIIRFKPGPPNPEQEKEPVTAYIWAEIDRNGDFVVSISNDHTEHNYGILFIDARTGKINVYPNVPDGIGIDVDEDGYPITEFFPK